MPNDSSPFPPFHLSIATFDAISSTDLDVGVLPELLSAERSRRLLMFHHVLSTCRHRPSLLGPCGPVERITTVLDDVQREQPDALEQLLLNPHTGMWLAYAVRLIEGSVTSEHPVWTQLGAVSAVAAAAATAGRVPFEVDVPTGKPELFLPGLGRIDLASWSG